MATTKPKQLAIIMRGDKAVVIYKNKRRTERGKIMSNYQNDLLMDDIREVYDELDEDKQAELAILVQDDLEAAWELAMWYADQQAKSYLRNIAEANR